MRGRHRPLEYGGADEVFGGLSAHFCMRTPLATAHRAYLQMSYYARSWSPNATVPPPIAFVTQQALHMSVNDSGFTVIDPNGKLVWPAVQFPDGLAFDAHMICADIVTTILAT